MEKPRIVPPDEGEPPSAEKIQMMTAFNITAKIAHGVSVAFNKFYGVEDQKPWEGLEPQQREVAVHLVMRAVANRKVTPARIHADWASQRLSEGWTKGDEFSQELKTDPRLVMYGDLPEDYRLKHLLFNAVVMSAIEFK